METLFTPGAEVTIGGFLIVIVISFILAEAFFRFLWLPGYEEDRKQSDDMLRSMLHDPTLLDAIDGTEEEKGLEVIT